MKDFYLQAMFSLLVLTGLTVSIYVYESTDELIQVVLYKKQPIGNKINATLSENNSVNQINSEILEVLEKESELIIQTETYAQTFQDAQFFEETAQSLRNHLGFVLVLYELSDEEFPVLTQTNPRIPLEARLSDTVTISKEEAEQFVRDDLENIMVDFQNVASVQSGKDQKVLLSYENLVLNKIK